MPEIKHTFTGGKMNKDLDERLVPNGEYRDAMNIQVRTTSGGDDGIGDAGSVQNIKGNSIIGSSQGDLLNHQCAGSVVDEKNDVAYFLFYNNNPIQPNTIEQFPSQDVIWTEAIIEQSVLGTTTPVVVDVYAVAQPFSTAVSSANFPVLQNGVWTQITLNDASSLRVDMTIKALDTDGVDQFNNAKIKAINGNVVTLYSEQTLDISTFTDGYGLPLQGFLFEHPKLLNLRPTSNIARDKITGINIIDDLLFYTDGRTEPKKINITRCKEGTAGFTSHTKLMVEHPITKQLVEAVDLEFPNDSDQSLISASADLLEKHITVIRKAPLYPPTIEVKTREEADLEATIDFNFGLTEDNIGDIFNITNDEFYSTKYKPNDILKFIDNDTDTIIKFKFISYQNQITETVVLADGTEQVNVVDLELSLVPTNVISIELISISQEVFDGADTQTYDISVDLPKPLFELKFPRFGYRYKYEDGEYSSFSPFSEIVFRPGNFDYVVTKAFNLGMVNTIRELVIKDFIPLHTDRPFDIKAIDILFKTADSPNIYVVKTIEKEKDAEWELFTPGPITGDDSIQTGELNITSEMIHRVLPSNQILRAFDNVPRYAKAQEVTSNRIVYGNYTQNYDINFPVNLVQSLSSDNSATLNDPQKSIKSIRSYKWGMVFGDKYGRETPVITSGYTIGDGNNFESFSGDIVTEKDLAPLKNTFKLQQEWESQVLGNGQPEDWMEYVKYYVKETTSEYYNLVMDRWYYAEKRENMWLSFPSADRNKIDEETYLLLKNEHGNQIPVVDKARYKVIAIENEAPDFIKIDHRTMGLVTLDTTDGNTIDPAAALFTIQAPPVPPDTSTSVPSVLISSTSLLIGQASFKNLLDRYNFSRTTNRGTIKFRFVGRTVNNSTQAVNNVLYSSWKTLTHYSSPEIGGTTHAQIFWNEPFGNDDFGVSEVDFFTRFTNALAAGSTDQNGVPITLALNTSTNLLTYNVEFKEEVVENKPEFDGRFFVLVEKDATLLSALQSGKSSTEYWGQLDSFNLAYIDSQKYNPGIGGDYGGDGTNNDNNPAYEWADGSFANSYEASYMALGCVGQDNLDLSDAVSWTDQLNGNLTILNYGDETRNFWQQWENSTNAGLFLDGARATDWENTPGDTWYNYKPTPLDYGTLTDGTLGRMRISTQTLNQAPAFNNVDQIYIDYMTTPGTIFEFANNPGVHYKVISAEQETNIIRNFGHPTWANAGNQNWHELYSESYVLANTGGSSALYSYNAVEYGEDFTFPVAYWGVMVPPNFNIAVDFDQVNPELFAIGSGGPFNVAHLWSSSESYSSFGEWDEGASQFYQNIIDSVEANSTAVGPIGPIDVHSSTNLDGDHVIIGTTHPGDQTCGICDNLGPGIHAGCGRHSVRFEFRKLGENNQELNTGIDLDVDPDPRAVNAHDGSTRNLVINILQEVGTAGGVQEDFDVKDGACWETEPKEDVDLELYYNATPALPMSLNKGNTTAFVPPNAGVDSYYIDNQGNEIYSTFTTYDTTPYISGYDYSATNPVIGISSELNGVTAEHKAKIGIGSMICFTHKDGTITKSKVNNYYSRTVQDVDGDGNNDVYVLQKQQWYNVSIQYNDATGGVIFTDVGNQNLLNALPISNNNDISIFGNGIPNGLILNNYSGNTNDFWISDTAWMNQGNGAANTVYQVFIAQATGWYEIDSEVWQYPVQPGWFNCYSFGNGVESDRIRDDFNGTQLDNGVRVSTTFEDYKEETRSSGLIYSGIYNSTSGINDLNEFNIAEKITKDLNPTYGSIQALKTRDTDVVVFTEDKVLKLLSNKDALFNADGNPQLTATDRVLGQSIPFVGDYGISKNPESLATDQYRMYFTDKQRGAVLRLSRDGLTPISNVGMKTYFRENLKNSEDLIGSFDKVNGEYNLTIERVSDSKTISFNEGSKGWVSFKSFIQDEGVSVSGKYFTVKGADIYEHYIDNIGGVGNYNTFYGQYTESTIDVLFNDIPGSVKSFQTVNYEGTQARVNKHVATDNATGLTTITDANGNTITNLSDGEYYNLAEKKGWYVESFETDMQTGSVPEFINKENKWFNKISGDTTNFDNLDTNEFSVQGIGLIGGIDVPPIPTGCTDPTAENYDSTAILDDGSCTFSANPCIVSITPYVNGVVSTTMAEGEVVVFEVQFQNAEEGLNYPYSVINSPTTGSSLLGTAGYISAASEDGIDLLVSGGNALGNVVESNVTQAGIFIQNPATNVGVQSDLNPGTEYTLFTASPTPTQQFIQGGGSLNILNINQTGSDIGGNLDVTINIEMANLTSINNQVAYAVVYANPGVVESNETFTFTISDSITLVDVMSQTTVGSTNFANLCNGAIASVEMTITSADVNQPDQYTLTIQNDPND